MEYSELYEQTAQSPLYGFLSLAVSILVILAMWKIFVKAGEPGWAAIIPFYNLYILFKIVYGNGWKFLLLLIPIANIVFLILVYGKLAKVFGKGNGFAVGLVLLPVVFLPILGFGDAKYQGIPA